MARRNLGQCECSDPGCPKCKGQCTRKATMTLYRVDMEDRSGTVFCTPCAEDAMESGLFDTERNFYSE